MKKIEELGISPAPWIITHHGEVYSQDGFIFGIKKVELGCRVVFTTEPDAHLIAAAPELYDALHDVVAYCESTHLVPSERFGKVLEKAKASLAKASGESEVVK